VAGKAVGGAVRRNRQRRRLREACRGLWSRIADRPADIVFVAQPAAGTADFAAVRREMETLLRRAGLLPATDESAGEAPR
jgi:ribonuclease P protein component